jgi:serine-type D-Ala-D-Ala carboxypeptidase
MRVSTLESDRPESAGMSSARLARLKPLLEQGLEKGVFPGAALVVARRGRVVLDLQVGQAALVPQPRPLLPDSIWDLASVTKPVAGGTAAMLLLEQGRLKLDDLLIRYVPEMPAGKERITIRHLLTHTAGLPSQPKLYHEHRTWESLLDGYMKLPLQHETGKVYLYSSIGFILLTLVLERVSGQPLDRFTREQIWEPLGMRDTQFTPPRELRERIPACEYLPHREIDDWGVVGDKSAQLRGGVSAHAGLFSTAHDLAVFGQMLLNGGAYGAERILSPLTVREWTRNHTPHLDTARGLSWWLDAHKVFGDLLGAGSIGHTGSAGTSLCIQPREELVVVLLTNRYHPTRDNEQIDGFRPLVHNAVAAAITE